MPMDMILDDDQWVESMLDEAKKNRKVTVDDIIHATIDVHKFRGAKEEPKGKGRVPKPAVEEDTENQPKNLRPSSPRSLKACLRLGVDPSEVIYRPVHTFPSRNPELQQIEYEQFETFRRHLLEKLRDERSNILHTDLNASTHKPGAAAKVEEDSINAMLEREKKRIEAQQKRNKREMTLILTNEGRMQSRRAAEEVKQDKIRAAEDLRQVELAKQDQEYKRAQKLREAERQKREHDELEVIRLASMEHLKKTQALADALDKQRVRRLEEAKLEEERRQAKAAQQRADLERALKEEQDMLMAKQKDMDRREVERQKMMALRKADRIKENTDKRMKTQEKVQTALVAGAKVAEQRKTLIQTKMDDNEKRLQALARQLAEDDKRRKYENEEKARQRIKKADEAKSIEQSRIDTILERQAQNDVQWDTFQKRFAWEQEKHCVTHRLKRDERKVKVDEMKRASAYQRFSLRQKIEDDTVRARKVIAARETLQEKRRMANIDASMQRQILNSAMEQMKVTKRWSKLNMSEGAVIDVKMIQEALRPVSAPLAANSNLLKAPRRGSARVM